MYNPLFNLIEFKHVRGDDILYEAYNIHNTFHLSGEEFALKALFGGTSIPDYYYVGLDNRSAIDELDELSDITGEPSTNGYNRQQVAANGEFTFSIQDDHNVAIGPIITFNASGGGWGPVSKIFLATSSDDSGYLLGSADLSSVITLSSGEFITLRMSLSLRDINA